MDLELSQRLLTEARRHVPKPVGQSRLMPHRETVLTHLAKGTSYEQIAAFFQQFGIRIQASAVGQFCRNHCPPREVLRVKRELAGAANDTVTPSRTLPSTPAAGRRNAPRIARDDL
jgi:hypothetical protein